MSKVFTITEGLENMGALKTGGQGSVYKTRRTGVIITAVKLLPTPLFSESPTDKNYVSFQNEVQKLKKVNEEPIPNVVKILSSGVSETGSFPFIEMEFIEGPDLEECLKQPHDPVFTIKETIKVAEHLAHALAHCHKQDVKHGDIKSNNVKYNVHTGNYVLLDFGMAVMSDEQRRTSLRQAGAIEFMAPEQSNGSMFFETDIYSYGVILFELLAGVVPFPLNDRNESSRNLVMVAHMETPPPDLLPLRSSHLPDWDAGQKEHELNVPGWLIKVIYKCLEKKPEDRFRNGVELREFIMKSSILVSVDTENDGSLVRTLREENKKLQSENAALKQQAEHSAQPAAFGESLRTSAIGTAPVKRSSNKPLAVFLVLALCAGLAFVIYYFTQRETGETTNTATGAIARTGEYVVVAPKAYFHDSPDAATRRSAYLLPSNEVIKTTDEQNGFVYSEFTNSKGQVSRGWIDKKDLVTASEWERIKKEQKETAKDTGVQLDEARNFLKTGDVEHALSIYASLSGQGIPEAMYQYGSLSLQDLNHDIDCAEGLRLIQKASDKDYTPAKRTLGLIYLFANDPDVLKSNSYDHCAFEGNTELGASLLTEAVREGDPDAQGLLDLYDTRNPGGLTP